MPIRLLCWGLAGLLSASAAGAGAFDGTYRQGGGPDCDPAQSDGLVRIEAGVFHGIATECQMQNPVDVRDMNAVLYDMTCQGNESGWTARALFMKAADDGLIMVWDGYAFKYDTCQPQADALPVVTRDANVPTDAVVTDSGESTD